MRKVSTKIHCTISSKVFMFRKLSTPEKETRSSRKNKPPLWAASSYLGGLKAWRAQYQWGFASTFSNSHPNSYRGVREETYILFSRVGKKIKVSPCGLPKIFHSVKVRNKRTFSSSHSLNYNQSSTFITGFSHRDEQSSSRGGTLLRKKWLAHYAPPATDQRCVYDGPSD